MVLYKLKLLKEGAKILTHILCKKNIWTYGLFSGIEIRDNLFSSWEAYLTNQMLHLK